MNGKIKIGVSACLLGHEVRYNGGHKHDPYLSQTLGRFLDFVPVCAESECGLTTPREAMRLEGEVAAPTLITIRTNRDLTEQMNRWTGPRLEQLSCENLCGFIFKKKSPSCGLYRVKIYNDKGSPIPKGRGLFAAAFTARFPRIPVEEEGRLIDPGLRETFLEKVFTLKRWRDNLEKRHTIGALVDFHTREKLLLMAHSPKHYRAMGKLVAEGKSMQVKTLYETYESLLMEALALKATAAKNTNVLMHIMGYFKKQFSSDEKKEVLEQIEDYRQGNLPLIVPVTLFKHFVGKYRQPYLGGQTYFNPHPIELQLRNHC